MPRRSRRTRTNQGQWGNNFADTSDDEMAANMNSITVNAVNTAPGRQDRVRELLQELRDECGGDYHTILNNEVGQSDSGQTPRAALVTDVGRYRRPSTLQIPLFLARPPGKEGFISVELFLKTVRRETRIGNFQDAERIMITRDHLRGPARIKFDNTDMVEETDWATFETRMKETFGIPHEKMFEKLHELMIHRKAGEPLSDYMERIGSELNNYSDTGDMPNADKVVHLKRILRTTLPREMRFPLEMGTNYDDLVACVLAYAEGQTQVRLTAEDIEREKEETAPRNLRGAATAAAAVSTYVPDNKKEEDEEVPPGSQPRDQARGSRETQGSSFRRTSHRGRGAPKYTQCDGCGGNHHKSVCRRSRNVTCFKCGMTGHFSFVCRKNGLRATESFPVATPNSMSRSLQQRPWAPIHRYPMSTFRPAAPPHTGMMAPPQYSMAPPHVHRAPTPRPLAPTQRPSAPAPAVAAAPMQWMSQGTFPWAQQQHSLSPPEEQQQQQQQQQQ